MSFKKLHKTQVWGGVYFQILKLLSLENCFPKIFQIKYVDLWEFLKSGWNILIIFVSQNTFSCSTSVGGSKPGNSPEWIMTLNWIDFLLCEQNGHSSQDLNHWDLICYFFMLQ